MHINSKRKWTDKNLKAGTSYKYYVKAYKLVDGKKVFISKSKMIRVTTSGGAYGNVTAVKVNKKDITLEKGKHFTIEATLRQDKELCKYTDIFFESTDKKIASVNKKGVIKAKGKGSCYIYVYAENGKYKKIKVTVE